MRASDVPEDSPIEDRQRIIVVSNRLPTVLRRDETGEVRVDRGHGGLARALDPLLDRAGGTWIGWPGVAAEVVAPEEAWRALADRDRLHPVSLSRDEIDAYYAGFASSVLWPLFHGLASRCEFGNGGWRAYQRVNRRFADAASLALGGEPGVVWIHDYHLILVAERLRERGVTARLGFFLHTPFPSLDDFVKLPWRGDILRALLAHDVIGFQSARDLRRFLACVEHLAAGASVARRGPCEAAIRAGGAADGRESLAGVFPIGIDAQAFARARGDAAVERDAARLRASTGDRALFLGVDRLDYTKGLPERLHAYERALERHPELAGRVVYVQVVVPSREQVPAYAQLKREIDRIVGRISGRYATTAWQPIRFLYASVSPDELMALYREADAALVTPLADGMNLVAKEYCAAQGDDPGVLVLSEMAGAASQLRGGALLVNPYDEDAMAEAMWRAYSMPLAEREARMRRLREVVARRDVYWWGEAFISTLLRDEPAPDAAAEVLPTIDVQPRVEPRQAPGG